ncbi:zinc finger protein 277 [Planococcus citri]|uniref:zinc finger protein 277 n=1 Tax=Planococcus citri TaxID=170843 RepID=UPI0031F9B34A
MPVVGYCRNLYNNLCPCFVCSKKFSLDNGVEDLLTHICFTHRIIIENIDQIADFKKYMEYYAKRYKEAALNTFAKEIVIEVPERDSTPKEQKYYLLGNFIPEDENLRKTLHSKRLKAAQKQQVKDMSDKLYIRHCFYCHQTIRVTNIQLTNHLKWHGFQLGHPEKLVYMEKFVEAIEGTFRSLYCLYCNMKFDSCRSLMTHMEEKNHLKIHPNDRFYDQFYMINYVEFGKTWMDFLKEKNKVESDQESGADDDDKEWSSWGNEPESIMCLFCKHICRSWDGTLLHMTVSHNFEFKSKVSQFSFYQQVKLVNYIRRRVINHQCINCDEQFDSETSLITHMEKSSHFSIPDKDVWNHVDYLFCAMENDMFLCHLEDQDEDEDNSLETRETSNIFRHYDVENSGSESGRSSFSQGMCYNLDSVSTSDSVLDEDQNNSIVSEDDNHIREFEEKIKVAFEKSKKIDVPTKHDTINHSKWKKPINAENFEEIRCDEAPKTDIVSKESDVVRQETNLMNLAGGGDSLSIASSAEERSASDHQANGSGDANVKNSSSDDKPSSTGVV